MLIPPSDASQAAGAAQSTCADIQNSTPIHDLLHELRQPLEVIDSLAFYVEMTSSDESLSRHMQTIRSMLTRMSHILEQHSAS